MAIDVDDRDFTRHEFWLLSSMFNVLQNLDLLDDMEVYARVDKNIAYTSGEVSLWSKYAFSPLYGKIVIIKEKNE